MYGGGCRESFEMRDAGSEIFVIRALDMLFTLFREVR